MAYDPNDPADKKILTDAITAREEELREEHEAEIEGLKTKNTNLLAKLSKARAGDGGTDNVAEVERLENELHEAQAKLRKSETDLRAANRTVETITSERDTARTELGTEQTYSRDLLVNGELTSALVAANVGAQFLPDVTASLAREVEIKEADGKRKAFVGDKSLGDFISEWSQGDRGKHYVIAPSNGGGGTQTNNGSPQGGAKRLSDMNDSERIAEFNRDPAAFDARVQAGENKPLPVVKT